MTNIRVSIIIPCYNHSHFLPRTLASIEAQAMNNELEAIIVDDGSLIPVSVCNNYPFPVTVIRQENQGLSSARNAGIKRARGQWIKFLDADDELLEKCISRQVAGLEPNHKAINVIGYEEVDSESGSSFVNYPQFGNPVESILLVNLAPIHCFLYPRTMLIDSGGFDESSKVDGGHEDYDLHLRLIASDLDVNCIQAIGAKYWKHAGSMSSNSSAMLKTRINVWCSNLWNYLNIAAEHSLYSAIVQGWIELTRLTNDLDKQLEKSGKDIALFLQQSGVIINAAEANELISQLDKLSYVAASYLIQSIISSDSGARITWFSQDIIDRRLLMERNREFAFDQFWLMEITDVLHTKGDYVIYGAGSMCIKLLDLIGERKKPLFIVDKNAELIKTVNTIPVYPVDALATAQISTVIVSALNYRSLIKKTLNQAYSNLAVI